MHPPGIDIFGSSRSEPDPPKALFSGVRPTSEVTQRLASWASKLGETRPSPAALRISAQVIRFPRDQRAGGPDRHD